MLRELGSPIGGRDQRKRSADRIAVQAAMICAIVPPPVTSIEHGEVAPGEFE